jgi:predicted AAA+ superfamily ATPase
MVKRTFWLSKITELWAHRPIIWLSGIRRSGKTVLCQSLPGTEYFDCELPRVRARLEDPEGFLESVRGKKIILDEVHRLADPAQLLKIAADHYPDVRVIATGASTLEASAKFKDTLTGRKETLWLTPLILRDLEDFKNLNFEHRLLHGGLPLFFLEKELPERDFQEWMDSYWAKDIQELFRLERRASFHRFLELLFVNSGGIFEASKYAAPCEVSRGTIANYLKAIEATYVAHLIRPFSSHKPTEIVSAPKVFAFDTGFVCSFRGWDKLRRDDLGGLWEHLVLNEIMANLQSRAINYWRTKQGREIDFILPLRGGGAHAVECKLSQKDFNPSAISSFRQVYKHGRNYAVCHDVDQPYSRRYGEIEVRITGLKAFIVEIVPKKQY